jgi:hypothetical protein
MLASTSAALVRQTKDRARFVQMTRVVAERRESKHWAQETATPSLELVNLCLLLHDIAQKYVPRTPQAFRDFDALTHATKALQRLKLSPTLAADLCAPTQTAEQTIITNSPEYRRLRNKFIAALSTIADMTDKNNPPGNPDYQRGVREGYRRASDIAILFLEDIQPGAVI